ncbi:MAG: SpoIID/LytB domain-containing protein [Cyanothece sp. SIO2G6]|nr:SpoIID/LytB domain-containing protein [Cyanothece sp. SIO2G6]
MVLRNHRHQNYSHLSGSPAKLTQPLSAKTILGIVHHFSQSQTLLQGWLAKILGLITLFFTIGIALPAQAALELRVAIEQEVDQVALGTSTTGRLLDSQGRVIAQIPAGGAFIAEVDDGLVDIHQWSDRQFWVEPTGDGVVYIGNKWYRGRTRVLAQPGGLTAVNYVDLEHYLYSVLGGEVPTNWPMETLKAQAVAARSYVLYRRDKSQGNVFDVGDTVSWQVYRGIEEEAPSTLAAVEATTGQVLTYGGRMVEAVFHSSSGGHTENVEDVWSSPIPYLRGVVDFDQAAPVYQWSKQISADELERTVSGIGNIRALTPIETTPRGRVVKMQVTGDEGTKVVDGSSLRSSLGLRSTLFSITPQSPTQTTPSTFSIYGRGFGHGVGMSQWGAYGMASQGYNYQQILGHYYQGTGLAIIEVQ